MSAQHSDATGHSADFDALTDLFLGEELSEPTSLGSPVLRLTTAPEDEELTTEVLLLGHLPVRANPWIAQYARLTAAREKRPVALVRMGAGQMGIDLYGLNPDFRECQAEQDAHSALARLAHMSAHIIFHVSDLDDLEIARTHVANRVTILTAANDAAVVSVYRTMKTLGQDLPEIGIAVMGEPEERANAAIEKLTEATRAFLNTQLVERGIIDRMGPTGGAMVFLGESELSHLEIVERIEALRTDARTSVGTMKSSDEDILSPPLSRSEWEELNPETHSVNEPLIAEPKIEHQISKVVPENAPVDHPELTHDEPTDAPSIALSLLELKPIGACCPDDEGVLIARDNRGVMHLICEDNERRGIERLTSVGSWANKHAKLLAALDHSLDNSEPAVLHLLTDAPKRVRHLLDCDVRVHAVARADARTGRGWCFLELN